MHQQLCVHATAFCTVLQISEPGNSTPALHHLARCTDPHPSIMKQVSVLPALQGPPPPDVAELHSQVAAAQASAQSSAEALATAQQQVRHRHTGGSELLGQGRHENVCKYLQANVYSSRFATLMAAKSPGMSSADNPQAPRHV